MKWWITVGCLLIATVSIAQEKLSCEDQLSQTQKQVLVLRSSRDQTEASLAAVLVRLDRVESELAKVKEVEKNVPK